MLLIALDRLIYLLTALIGPQTAYSAISELTPADPPKLKILVEDKVWCVTEFKV